ncbi:MAG: hypothetical protein ACRD0Q_07220, partial [Acidimicrobiales bacterium]
IEGVDAALVELATRRQMLADRLNQVTTDGAGLHWPRSHLPEALRTEVAGIDRRAATLTNTLGQLESQAQRRQEFLGEHAADLARRDLLRDAIAHRETKVRLAAPELLPAPLRARLPVPAGDRSCDDHRRWRTAVEHIALYIDRWAPQVRFTPRPGDEAFPGTDAQPLGRRPDDEAAARQWADATAAIAEIDPSTTPPAAAPELSPVR